MKPIAIGVEDFKKIIDTNSFYVDKTKGIEDIKKITSEVLLFTRPRRFGKSLFLSTLNYFYNLENSEENKKLFKGLYIESSPYFKEQGSYPVISISLKDLKRRTYKDMLITLHAEFRTIFDKIDSFNNLSNNLLENYYKLKNMEENAMMEALKIFTEAFYQHYKQKVILLIDEYEAPLLNAFQEGYHEEALKFFRIFYSSALKGNEFIEKAIITGITRISHASIFSGLNNLEIYDLTMKDFADTFGYTQDEVNKALKEYNLDKDQEEVKKFYDGYYFGDKDIYNPWSINNYLKHKVLKSYWTQTANSSIIYKLLLDAPENIKKKYIALAKGESIIYTAINFLQLQLQDLSNPNKLFEFMISTGYLNYDSIKGQLKVVNKEVLSSLPDITENGLFTTNKDYINFKNAIRDNDLKLLEPSLNNLLGDIYSYFDFPKNSNESNYHVAITTLLAISGIGEVKSNLEAGLGRFDIAFTSNHPTCYSFIIEIKRASSKKEINNLLDESIKQVKDKNYLNYIKDREKKGIICFCFYQKQVRVKYELL